MGSACTQMDDDHVVVGPVDATTLPSPHHTSIVPSPTLHTAYPAANDPTRLIHLKQVVRKKTANAQFHSIPVSQDEPRTTTPTTTFVPQLPLWPPPRRDPSPNPSPTISLCSNQPVLHLFGARLMHPTGAPFEVLGTTTLRPSDPPLMSSGSSPQRVESLTTMTTSSSRTPRKQSCSARTVRSSFQGPNASDAFSSVYEL